MMVSCGDSKAVFAFLRKLCIDLKKDDKLPLTLALDDKRLQYEHVADFIKLLGFTKDVEQRAWVCDAAQRVETRLIDSAILECLKCRELIHKAASTVSRVQQNRKDSKVSK